MAPSPALSLQPYFTLPFALHLRPLPHVSFLAERSSGRARDDGDGGGPLSSEDNLSASSSSASSSRSSASGSSSTDGRRKRLSGAGDSGRGGQRAGTHKLRPHVQAPPPHSLDVMSILMERTRLLEAIEPLAEVIKMLEDVDDDKEFTRLRRFFDARFDDEGNLIGPGGRDKSSASSPTKKGFKGFGMGRTKSKSERPQQQRKESTASSTAAAFLWKKRPSTLRQGSGGGEGSSWMRALSPEGQQQRKLSHSSGNNLSLGALGQGRDRRPSFRVDGLEQDIAEGQVGDEKGDEEVIEDGESISVHSPPPSSPSRLKMGTSPPGRLGALRGGPASQAKRNRSPMKAPEIVAKRKKRRAVRFNVRLDLHHVGLAPPPPPQPKRARSRSKTTGSMASRSSIARQHQQQQHQQQHLLVSSDHFATSPSDRSSAHNGYGDGAPLEKVTSPESVHSTRSLGQLSEENSGSHDSGEQHQGRLRARKTASRTANRSLPFGSPPRNPSKLGGDATAAGESGTGAPVRSVPADAPTPRLREAHDSDREAGETSEGPSSSASHGGQRRTSRKSSGLTGLFGGGKDPTGNRRPSMIQRLMGVGRAKPEAAMNKSNTSLALVSNTSSEALGGPALSSSAEQADNAGAKLQKQMPSLPSLQVPPPSFATDGVSPTSHGPPTLDSSATLMGQTSEGEGMQTTEKAVGMARGRSKTIHSEWSNEEALDLGDDELEGSMGGSSAGWSRSMRSSFGATSSLPFRGRASSGGTAATGAPASGWMAWSVPKGDPGIGGAGGGATGLMLEPELRPVQEGRAFDSDSVFSGRSGQPEGSFRVFSDGDEEEEDEEDDDFDGFDQDHGRGDAVLSSWVGRSDFLSLLRLASEKALSLAARSPDKAAIPSEKALGKKPEGEVTPQQETTRPNSIELDREEMADALLEATMGQSVGPKGLDAEDGWWPCGSADPLPIAFACALAEALGWQGVMRLCYGKGSLCARSGDFGPLGRAADINDKQKEDSEKVERWARDVSASAYASPRQSVADPELPSGLTNGQGESDEDEGTRNMPELAPQTTIESSLAPSESASTKAAVVAASSVPAITEDATSTTAAQALLGKWMKKKPNNRPGRSMTMPADGQAAVPAAATSAENASSAGAIASSGDEGGMRKGAKRDRTWDDWSRLSVSMASWVQEYEKCRVRNGLAREYATDPPWADEEEEHQQDSGFVEASTKLPTRKDSGTSLEVPSSAGEGSLLYANTPPAQAQVPLCVRTDAVQGNHGYRRRHGIPEGLPLGPDGQEMGDYRWARSKLKPRHFATSMILSTTSLSYFFGQLASSPWVHTSSWELDYLEMCVFKSPFLAQRFPPPGPTIARDDQSFQPSPSSPEAARAKPCPNPTLEGWWNPSDWVEWLGQVKEGMIISPAVSFQAWWTLIAALNGADGSGRNFNLQVKAYDEPFDHLLKDHDSVYL
ncbi:hypothetical protein FA10DRAFT_268489 [Acaromyces ingoldii]|uniref:Uncharacterized protein n=1 Tax=Acaromyces ingoldii TaxID=215250 RepID=A0A316YGP2_9BASI|nr:hypothetical protein FA10DRAFT_268489 [Acaromyces ingoldii]PWN88286.1 hypothetical protein FA10DRAFT_268489 [Acaromyces ingoldii]